MVLMPRANPGSPAYAGYWGGVMTYQMRIVSLGVEELAIRYLYTEDRTNALRPK